MKHAIIFAHPRSESFIGSLAQAYEDAATGLGHQVVTRDLYRLGFQPCLQAEELPFDPNFQPRADVQQERTLLADVDVFALIYPLWLNSPPAMLKGYLERVFGFGFAYGKHGRSEPLLAGRRLISFSSSGAPLHWVEQTGAFGAVKTLFDQYFAELCGMHFVEHIHFGAITPGIRDDAVARFLAQARSAVSTHFGRTA
jgi:NAD(P)H dehydrogenase (quinone)